MNKSSHHLALKPSDKEKLDDLMRWEKEALSPAEKKDGVKQNMTKTMTRLIGESHKAEKAKRAKKSVK